MHTERKVLMISDPHNGRRNTVASDSRRETQKARLESAEQEFKECGRRDQEEHVDVVGRMTCLSYVRFNGCSVGR